MTNIVVSKRQQERWEYWDEYCIRIPYEEDQEEENEEGEEE